MTRDIRNKTKLRVAGIIVAVVILFDLTPLGGNITTYSWWLRCGGRPLQSGPTAFYDVPYYIPTPVFKIFRGTPKYFCTVIQAEKAGYSASRDSFNFPHLSGDEVQISISKAHAIMSKY